MKAKTYNTLEESECRLYGERVKTFNHIISKFCKREEKEHQKGHNWVGKVIYWELCKRLKFNLADKLYMIKNSQLLWNTNGSPRGCHRGAMVKAMDWGIVVSEFVLQSRYYVPFRAYTLGKCMNPLILQAVG